MQKAKRIVLGEGEIVGHKHILESSKDIDYVETDNKISFMRNPSPIASKGTGLFSPFKNIRKFLFASLISSK